MTNPVDDELELITDPKYHARVARELMAVDDELRAKINTINLKHMGDTGWNGKEWAEVYQAAMDEIMQLVLAWRSQGVGETCSHEFIDKDVRTSGPYGRRQTKTIIYCKNCGEVTYNEED